MTPMIDVVFLLIIFFLCIEFRVLEARLPAYLPKDKGSSRQPAEPQEQLRLRIVCDERGREEPRTATAFRLVGHRIHFQLDARRVETLEELRQELAALARDPSRRVLDPAAPGRTKRLPVVIEPGVRVVYGDVAPCVDAVMAAGFQEVHFGGGRGGR